MTHKRDDRRLEIIHDHHIKWNGKVGVFHILGHLSMDVSSLRVSLHIERKGQRKQRLKLDLYDYNQVSRHCTHLSEEEGFVFGELEKDMFTLTELLEKYREERFAEAYAEIKPTITKRLPLETEKNLVDALKRPSLLEDISSKLGQIGIAGEVNNRLLLFIIGTSYKHVPLHAVIQSSSGSGKSHLINTIADCFPKEEVLSLSRITSKSLYHYKKDTLKNKLILIQDFDGLDDEALYAFRELQSFGELTTSMTGKDAFGNHTAKLHTVEAHFASFGASTKELYLDNSSRSILLKIDESEEQTKRILNYEAPLSSQIAEIKMELGSMIRLLKPETVSNPFASSLCLPSNIPMARRLNNQLKQFVEQITYLHQYQRARDERGRILTTKEDIKTGIDLFFECLWLKVDELPPAVRTFYEKLKSYVEGKTNQEESEVVFNQRELRSKLLVSRSALHRYIKTLLEMEYIKVVRGSANKGYGYAVRHFDNEKELKQILISGLQTNIS